MKLGAHGVTVLRLESLIRADSGLDWARGAPVPGWDLVRQRPSQSGARAWSCHIGAVSVVPQILEHMLEHREWSLGVRAAWLRQPSPHWWPGLVWLVWRAGGCPLPASLLHVHPPKVGFQWERTTFPDRGGLLFGQRGRNSCPALLEPPNELSKTDFYRRDIK